MEAVENAFAAERPPWTLDGVTVELGDGAWFNLRASNTEPLLRLNAEAPTSEGVDAVVDEVLAIVRA